MEPLISFVDVAGSVLSIKPIRYQFSNAADPYDANWLCCCISLSAVIAESGNRFEQSVNGFLRTEELRELAEMLQTLLAPNAVGVEAIFQPLEPYIQLQLRREEKNIQIDAVIDLSPCVGPEIRVKLNSRLGEMQLTLESVMDIIKIFPER